MATGNVRKRINENGTVYQLTIDYGKDPATGKRKREFKTVHGSKRQAEAELNRILAAVGSSNYVVNTSSMTLAAWMNDWIDLYCINVEESTLDNYIGQINRYIIPELGNIPLNVLTNQHVQGWINRLLERGLAPKTVRNVYMNLQAATKKAVKLRMINHDPCDGTEVPSVEKPEYTVYDATELRVMLDHAQGTDMYFPLLLESVLGLRRGELLALRWEDVDFDEGVVHIHRNRIYANHKVIEKAPKTKAGIRDIAIGSDMVEIMKEEYRKYLRDKGLYEYEFDDSGYVIRQEKGQPYHPHAWKNKWKRFLEKEELNPIRFHDLRHSNATALIEMGIDPKTVQQRMGHSTIAVTMDIYTHATAAMKRTAGEKMDAMFFGNHAD